ncbi:hypothetical protein [Phenylobacterium montanum]|uniref:Uncharacterized protein n=1 Tax=Phenylobacterium montanum TaxID=2823693 RepID=A0A975IU54_9CAUL|nr:hypothetical protein [Caulobacter sp. S6]QUD87587.1 hypothetical protein KCG34_21455 [Caulobacter sp. S6]
MLRELGEIGMRVARAMGERAAAAAEDAEVSPAEAAQAASGFSRVARAVRQTLALEARLAEGAPPRGGWRQARAPRAGVGARSGDDDRLDDEPDDEDLREEREWLGDPDEDLFAGLDLEAGVEALTAAVRRQAAETAAVLRKGLGSAGVVSGGAGRRVVAPPEWPPVVAPRPRAARGPP